MCLFCGFFWLHEQNRKFWTFLSSIILLHYYCRPVHNYTGTILHVQYIEYTIHLLVQVLNWH